MMLLENLTDMIYLANAIKLHRSIKQKFIRVQKIYSLKMIYSIKSPKKISFKLVIIQNGLNLISNY